VTREAIGLALGVLGMLGFTIFGFLLGPTDWPLALISLAVYILAFGFSEGGGRGNRRDAYPSNPMDSQFH
jgi:hypothetical protein